MRVLEPLAAPPAGTAGRLADRADAVAVWAPDAHTVELDVEGETLSMERDARGWWHAPLEPNRSYGFRVDGGDVRPDPRAERLAQGVHGPASRFDPTSFDWSDGGFVPSAWSQAVIYELHVGTFTQAGTFEAAIERLDDLVGLGVTHVELMPVAAFPGRFGWGYDGVGLFAVHEAYGGPEALCRFVDACHRRGLGAILDVVYNHLGPEGNYWGVFGPYFTDRVHTPWGAAVNLDGPGCDEVRRLITDNAVWWLDGFHFDGLRLDAIHALEDKSAVHLLEELRDEVDAATSRPRLLIAESDLNDPRVVTPKASGGLGMDAQWADDLHHALHAKLTGESAGYYQDFGGWASVAKGLRSPYVIDGRHAAFRNRRHGRPAGDAGGHRFVVYDQTHDQVGNRARGDRLHHICGEDRALLAAALTLTSPGVPMLFMGEEWAASSPFPFFCDFQDPNLKKAVKKGRREEFKSFGWNPDRIPDATDPETFRRAVLDWSERDGGPHRRVLDGFRTLLRIRREHPELTDGDRSQVQVGFDEAQEWIHVCRGRIHVVAALAPVALDLPADQVLYASKPVRLEAGRLELPADGVAVCRSTNGPT